MRPMKLLLFKGGRGKGGEGSGNEGGCGYGKVEECTEDSSSMGFYLVRWSGRYFLVALNRL